MLYWLLLCGLLFTFACFFTFLLTFLPPRSHTFFMCFQIEDVFHLVIAGRACVLQYLRADVRGIIAWPILAEVCNAIFINPVVDFGCSYRCAGTNGQ